MHRSAIGAISIDIPEAQFDRASEFWTAALATTARRGTTHPEFSVLAGGFGGLTGLLQRVGDPGPRVHLDLHTDNVPAEVTRLVALGATEVGCHDDWVVLADPAGTVFCVVPTEADDPLLDGAAVHAD